MNGLKRLLAMALAMLLLILPAAMAEENTATAHTLTISNIAVNAAGVDLLDLEGLSVEMTAADTGDAVEFVLRLLGGEDAAAEGYALFDGRELVLGADGLSSAYALPLEKMMGDDIAPALQLFAEMLSEDTLIGLVNAVVAPFVSLAENAMATQVDEGVQTIDHTVGQVEMQGYTYTITGDMLREFAESLEMGLKDIPVFSQLVIGAGAAPDAYNDEKSSMGGDLDGIDGEYTITIWMATDEAGMPIIREEGRLELSDGAAALTSEAVVDGYAEGADYVYTGWGESTADGVEESAKVDVSARIINFVSAASSGDLSGLGLEMDMTAGYAGELTQATTLFYHPMGYDAQSADRATFALNMELTSAEDVAESFSAEGYYSPADGVNYLYDEFYGLMQFSAAGQTQTAEVTVQTQHADGYEYYGAQIAASDPYSGAQSFYFTYEGDYTENALGSEDNAGVLTLGATMGYEGSAVNYAVTADVSMTHAAVDPASLPAPTGETVDLLMLDEKGYEQLASEGSLLAMRLVGTLGQNVPGLAQILSGIDMF